jgi:hypothetical protein
VGAATGMGLQRAEQFFRKSWGRTRTMLRMRMLGLSTEMLLKMSL